MPMAAGESSSERPTARIRRPPGIKIDLQGEPGVVYSIEWTTQAEPAQWNHLVTARLSESMAKVVDGDTGGQKTRFYRAVEE